MIKKRYLFLMIIVCLFTISAVSAVENITDDIVGVAETTDEVLNVEIDPIDDGNGYLGANSNSSFTDLANDMANANGLLILSKNYVYDSSRDSNYTNGIVIDKKIMVIGFGGIINGNNQARAFNVSSSDVMLMNIEFINCSGSGSGGAVYWNGANGNLSYCNFVNCYSSGSGGAVYWNGISGRLESSTFVSNYVPYDGNSGYSGGAVYWNGVDGMLENSTFVSNSAFGGGAVSLSGDSCVVKNSSFTNNYAGGSGGAVSLLSADSVIVNSTFVNNHASFYAGAIDWFYIRGSGGLLVNSTFVNNYARYGGAVYYHGNNGISYDCTFDSNHANDLGGAVYWYGNSGVLYNSNFVNNHASSSGGGAVYWSGNSGMLFNSNFVNNHASSSGGGAVYWSGNSGVLVNSTFVNNYVARDNGGAVYWDGNAGILHDCTFDRNHATGSVELFYIRGSGGAVYWKSDYGVLANSTIVNNSADSSGGAVYWAGNSGVLANSTIVNNSADDGNAVYWKGYSSAIHNSVVLDGIYDSGYSVNTWFGNNASNYENNPYSKCESWLFLNASSVPMVGVNSKSTVTFTLDNLYNSSSKTISHPDISYLPDVVFKLSTVNGYLNKYTVRPGESVIFKTNGHGDGIVRATYGNVSYSISIVNLKVDTNLTAEDVVAMYSDDSRLIAKLKDDDGNPISGVKVKFTIGSLTKTMNTYASGKAFISTKSLAPGNYVANVSYDGDEYHTSANTTVNVVVKKMDTVLTAEDVVVVYRDDAGRLIVELKDASGNPISGAKVTLSVGGLTKTMKTYASGKAYIGTKTLAPGDYIAIVTFDGDDNYAPSTTTANVAVRLGAVLTAEDVVVVHQDASGRWIVELKDASGNPIGGAKVKITVGGLTKTMNTYASGKAFISTKSLAPGDYIASVSYAGDDYYAPASATANVAVINDKVITVLTAKDAVVVCGDDSGRLVVELKDADGNPIGGAKVKITVGNLTKTMNTYASGKAFISTKSLAPGDYVASVSYAGHDIYAPASTTANVNVKMVTVLTAEDVVATCGDSSRLIVELKDTDGNPISGVKVKFKIGNLTKSMNTYASGKAYINTKSLAPGNYTAVITCAGNEDYASSSITANVLIRE